MPETVSETDVSVAALPAALIWPITRIGERVASLDARTSSEIGAVKKDTESLRDQLHRLANSMQESMAMSRLQDQKIGYITEGHTRLSMLVERLGETTVQLGTIGTKFLDHVEACNKRGANIQKGVWLGVSVAISALSFLLIALATLAWTHFGAGK